MKKLLFLLVAPVAVFLLIFSFFITENAKAQTAPPTLSAVLVSDESFEYGISIFCKPDDSKVCWGPSTNSTVNGSYSKSTQNGTLTGGLVFSKRYIKFHSEFAKLYGIDQTISCEGLFDYPNEFSCKNTATSPDGTSITTYSRGDVLGGHPYVGMRGADKSGNYVLYSEGAPYVSKDDVWHDYSVSSTYNPKVMILNGKSGKYYSVRYRLKIKPWRLSSAIEGVTFNPYHVIQGDYLDCGKLLIRGKVAARAPGQSSECILNGPAKGGEASYIPLPEGKFIYEIQLMTVEGHDSNQPLISGSAAVPNFTVPFGRSVTFSGTGFAETGNVVTLRTASGQAYTQTVGSTNNGTMIQFIPNVPAGLYYGQITTSQGDSNEFDLLVTGSSVPTTNTFSIGDSVVVDGNSVNVRTAPSTSATQVISGRTQPAGTTGVIRQGAGYANPTKADGYTWWYVDYATGPDGWSVENYLKKYITTTPPPAVADTVAPTMPFGATALLENGNSIRFIWKASTDVGSGIAGYRVYRNDSLRETTTSLSAYDGELPAGTTSCWSVAAYDKAGNTSARTPNSCATATTVFSPVTTVPTTPTVTKSLSFSSVPSGLYTVGSTVPIRWSSAQVQNLSIDLYDYKGTSKVRNITRVPASQNSYTWTIPSDIDFNFDTIYTIRISDVDQPSLYKNSGKIEITPPSVPTIVETTPLPPPPPPPPALPTPVNLLTAFSQGSSYSYDTFNTSGNSITSALETTGNIGGAASNALTLDTTKSYKLAYTLTQNSGTAPNIRFVSTGNGRSYIHLNSSGGRALDHAAQAGTQSVTFTPSVSTGYIEISVGSGSKTDFSMSNMSLEVVGPTAQINSNFLANIFEVIGRWMGR